MTKKLYVTRQQAVDDARRLGYVGFRTWLEEDMWHLSYHAQVSPGMEWLLRRPAERREFVHHCECYYENDHLVPVLVVNVTKDECEEEGDVIEHEGRTYLREDAQWFLLEPVCRELWQNDTEKALAKLERRGFEQKQKSTIMGATKLVWEIADSMPDAGRKEVMDACAARGISKNTASTQYYHWSRKRKENAG